MPIQKPIDIKNIPPAQKLGAKQSQVPEILKQCIKGQALPITNTYKETPTIITPMIMAITRLATPIPNSP